MKPSLIAVRNTVCLLICAMIIPTQLSAFSLKKNNLLANPVLELAIQTDRTDIQNPVQPAGRKESGLIKDKDWPWWYWAISLAAAGVVIAVAVSSADSSSSDSGDSCQSGPGTCGSTVITW